MTSNKMTKFYVAIVNSIIYANGEPTTNLRIKVPNLHSGLDDDNLPIAKPLYIPGMKISRDKFLEQIKELKRVVIIFEYGDYNRPLYLAIPDFSNGYELEFDQGGSEYETLTESDVLNESTVSKLVTGELLAHLLNGVEDRIGTLSQQDIDNASEDAKLLTGAFMKSLLDNMQEPLVSGVNIKTINSESVLGAGNLLVRPYISETEPSPADAPNGVWLKSINETQSSVAEPMVMKTTELTDTDDTIVVSSVIPTQHYAVIRDNDGNIVIPGVVWHEPLDESELKEIIIKRDNDGNAVIE